MLVAEKVFFCLADILPPLFIQLAFADKIEEIQDVFQRNMFKIAMCQQCLEKSFEYSRNYPAAFFAFTRACRGDYGKVRVSVAKNCKKALVKRFCEKN